MKDVTGGGYGVMSTVTYTNYGDSCKPLPDFKLPTGTATSVFQTFSTVTIDGIKFESSHNTSNSGSSFDSGAGICVYLQGKNSTVKNCEVTDCDFGIMLQGDGSLATQNYVHDVNGQALDGTTSSDPNSVGGGKGIYAMANNVEVSYNTIIDTITFPNWTGASGSSKGGCDGGATEIAVQSGATLTGYKNHHNFAYYTCGFFQASTTTGSTGTFSNSEFSYNVMIDTAWMILAQVNNTNFVNMNWQNNTVVQHKNAGATADQGMLMEMWNGESSGVSGGTTPANQIFLTNKLMVLEGVYDNYDFSASYVTANSMANNSAIVLSSNIFLPNTSVNPGFFKLGDGDPNFTNTTDGTTMPAAADYDLTSDTTTLANTLSGEPTTISVELRFRGSPLTSLGVRCLRVALRILVPSNMDRPLLLARLRRHRRPTSGSPVAGPPQARAAPTAPVAVAHLRQLVESHRSALRLAPPVVNLLAARHRRAWRRAEPLAQPPVGRLRPQVVQARSRSGPEASLLPAQLRPRVARWARKEAPGQVQRDWVGKRLPLLAMAAQRLAAHVWQEAAIIPRRARRKTSAIALARWSVGNLEPARLY